MKRITAALGLLILGALNAVAQNEAGTNAVNQSSPQGVKARILPNYDTNKIRKITADQLEKSDRLGETSEQHLLDFFPQLLWSRAKLEFIFEERGKMAADLEAGANTDDEAFKLAKDTEGVFKKDDGGPTFDEGITMLKEGLKMSGRLHAPTVNFSKANYTLNGITGEAQLLFDQEKLISFSFWTDGTDTDFANLYKIIVAACNSPGKRVSYGKDHSEISWTISGRTNRYDVQLSHRNWGGTDGLERGMTIFIKHPPFDSALDK